MSNESGESDLVKTWRAVGRKHLMVRDLTEVSAWAEANGGELGVRHHLAEGGFGLTRGVAERWLELEERKRLLEYDRATLQADQRAATAAERAARYAMWSAIISLVTVIVSVIGSCSSPAVGP